jgi:competence protein ComEC
MVLVAALLLGSSLSARSWAEVNCDRGTNFADYAGPAVLTSDPVHVGAVTHTVLSVGGKRYDVWATGSPGRRLLRRSAMQVVWVEGRLGPLRGTRWRRLAVRHIVGQMDVRAVLDWSTGSPLARSTQRTRDALARGAMPLDAVDRSLFLGLVIGDDRAEPTRLVDDFRRSGLGHLTAVSGQNVAFLLAVATPLLRRCRPGWRWMLTIGLLAWFAALTRFEPSVLRATVMAGLAATAFTLGRSASPVRLLGLAVTALVLVDPFLVWAPGFWLSVSATAGIVLLARRLAAAIPGPRWIALAVGVTLSAQVGVAPVAWTVFGREAVWALPANLLAEPVAAFVMTYGLPAGLLAGLVPAPVAALLHGPTLFSLRWIRLVAATAAQGDWPWARPFVSVAGALLVLWLLRRSTRAVGSAQ